MNTAAQLLRRFTATGVVLWAGLGWAQVTWDGGGNNDRWSKKKNWSSDDLPGAGDAVLLDNSQVGALPSAIELRADQKALSLTFTTGDSVALVNGTGSRSLDLYSGQITRTAGSSGSQSLDFSYLDLRADGDFDISGSGSLTISSVIREGGGGASSVTKSGDGALILSGANTFAAGVSVTGGTLQVSSDANLGDNANDISLDGGTLGTTGSFTMNSGRTVTVGAADGSIAVASGETLTFGTAGQLAGAGALTKTGGGTLSLTALPTFSDTLILNAGTLRLSDISLSLADLQITGNSTIDFAGVSSLSVTNFSISAGITLTISNWMDASDYFVAQNWSGAAFDIRGAAPMNQVAFSGASASDTVWQSYDKQVTPVPEPAAYGAWLLLAAGGLLAFRGGRRDAPPSAPGAKSGHLMTVQHGEEVLLAGDKNVAEPPPSP